MEACWVFRFELGNRFAVVLLFFYGSDDLDKFRGKVVAGVLSLADGYLDVFLYKLVELTNELIFLGDLLNGDRHTFTKLFERAFTVVNFVDDRAQLINALL